MNGKKKKITVTRGYRLKPSTHKLIKQIQEDCSLSQEEVIRKAVKSFYIIKNEELKNN